jgi:O-antigen/teichoic acid export membrane protein
MRRFLPDLQVALLLLALPLVLFAPVVFGNRTLLPADNLLAIEPWRSASATFAEGQRAPDGNAIPHNNLLSDLVLENYPWKRFILRSLQAGELPLWNPHQFAGLPFLAAGQHSALYPFSIIFYAIPLPRAYGVFTVSQLFLAGLFTYLFLRGLGLGRLAATFGAIVYELSLFMVVSVVFTMIIAAAAWLPLVLLALELVLQQRPCLGGRPATLPWVVLGALALGFQIYAGHVEITYYTFLIAGLYSAWGLGMRLRAQPLRPTLSRAAALLALALFGLTLGALQFIPLFELVQHNFRSGSATFDEIIGWAYPWRHLLAVLIPNFYGNPSHHTFFDLFTWQTTLAPLNNHTIDWGIKNYVEGGAYVGLLPLMLTLLIVGYWLLGKVRRANIPITNNLLPFFLVLALLALAFIFPTRWYALIFWLPGISQLHSPFRWVWPLTLCLAVLAAYGLQYLKDSREEGARQAKIPSPKPKGSHPQSAITNQKSPVSSLQSLPSKLFFLDSAPSLITFFAGISVWGGTLVVVSVSAIRLFYSPFAGLMDWFVSDWALANQAFTDGRMFFSYQAPWLALFGLMWLSAGIVLRVSRCPIYVRGRPAWEFMALGVIALDLLVAGYGFNPAADPAILNYVPPSVDFLRQDTGLWRFTTFDPTGQKPYNANLGWYFDFDDIRGYDSIFPMQYRRYMELIEPQNELEFNRIAPLTRWESLDSPLLDLLNVKYIITPIEIPNPKYALVYDGEVKIYRNQTVVARAYLAPLRATLWAADFGAAAQTRDPRQYVITTEADFSRMEAPAPAWPTPIADEAITRAANEVTLNAETTDHSWLVLNDSYFAGWKAFVRPVGAGDAPEKETPVYLVNGNFRGVVLTPGAWTVRFKYTPTSVKLGGILAFLAGISLVFGMGVFAWRHFYSDSAVDSTARRVAKNSLAPMALNLLNRAIDLTFAAFYLRVLGPGEVGKYSFAIVIFGWFEIVTNYGLNTLLTREASRDQARANRHLVNTTILRLLIGLIAIPALVLLLGARQALPNPLTPDTLWAIGLLVLGQIPATIATGLSALFYVYEKAEYPAAVATVATILKVALGTVALGLGGSFVGLAGVSVLLNIITLAILAILVNRLFFRPTLELDWGLQRAAVRESFPLMLNHLLATLFFKVDVPLLETIRNQQTAGQGNREVGWYRTAYMFVDAFNVIPSFFTFALFPLMSRQAQADRPALARSYALAVKLLVAVALPVAVATTFLAPTLIGLIGGPEFLPYGALALALMVWSIPLGWINSVTNYVLIALNQQRQLTKAFAGALLFNIILNIIFIPLYGYPAAAIITIFSEIFEGALFYRYVRRSLSAVPWLALLWRLWLSAVGMAGLVWVLWSVQPLLALLTGSALYCGGLIVLEAFTPAERGLLLEILPTSLRRQARGLVNGSRRH